MLVLKLIFERGSKRYEIDCKKEYSGTTHAIKRGKEVLKSFQDIERATIKIIEQATNQVKKELAFNKGVWRIIK